MLGDTYVLERFASADENTASFDTSTGGERSAKALARVIRAEAEAAERQLDVWQAIKMSGHPHLLSIWGAGRAHADGNDLIYVVVEAADENLASVLGDRALEPAEAGEILVSMVWALGHLHSHGFVHGSLSPEQILAVGETVKLSSGGVRRIRSTSGPGIHKAKYLAPESVEGNITAAADIWCLGATLVETLTQRACEGDCAERYAQLPSPFDAIARSCLQANPAARGTLAQLLTLYEGQTVNAVAVAPEAPKTRAAAAGAASAGTVLPASPQASELPEPTVPVYLAPGPLIPEAEAFSAEAFSSAGETVEATESSASEPAAGAPNPSSGDLPIHSSGDLPIHWRDTAAVRPERNAPGREDVRRAKQRAWIFVAIALAILFAVVWVLRPSRSQGNHVQTAQKSSTPASGVKHGQTMTLPAADAAGASTATGTSNPPASELKTTASPAKPATPSVSSASATQASPAGRGPVWHVILYAYNRRADAAKRTATVNRRHPELKAEVFMPNGADKPPYLVSIGGSTNHEEMAQLRRNAIRLGLPRDAYLQNYGR